VWTRVGMVRIPLVFDSLDVDGTVVCSGMWDVGVAHSVAALIFGDIIPPFGGSGAAWPASVSVVGGASDAESRAASRPVVVLRALSPSETDSQESLGKARRNVYFSILSGAAKYQGIF
jgi:hypothetical protein